MRMNHVLMSGVLTGGLVLGSASAAFAATSGSIANTATKGVVFEDGRYSFDPWPCNSSCRDGRFSGFNYSGSLRDTTADGDTVFIHAKVDGYGYRSKIRNTRGPDRSIPVAQKVLGGADPASTANVQVCRDRGSLVPNNCESRTISSGR